MAIHINLGHVPDDRDKPRKHLDERRPALEQPCTSHHAPLAQDDPGAGRPEHRPAPPSIERRQE